DLTSPAGTFGAGAGDGKVDAVVACPPDIGVMAGNGDGTFAAAQTYHLGVPFPTGAPTVELLRIARLGPTVSGIVWQRGGPASNTWYLCTSVLFTSADTACAFDVPVFGALAVGRLNQAAFPDQDMFVATTPNNTIGLFANSGGALADVERSAGSSAAESIAVGDLDGDGVPDVLMGHAVNSVADRVPDALTFHLWNSAELTTTNVYGIDPLAVPGHLTSIAGLDAVGIADIDGDGHNDIVGMGAYGRGIVHLGDGAGNFDGGHDVPLIAYQDPAASTRVTLGFADFDCDGTPDLAITDDRHNAVSVLLNRAHPNPAASCK
ncbi:MAG TPA: VCBS repeat-containing protein, partial [Polyangia bacterium]